MADAEDTTLPKQTPKDRVSTETAAENRSLIDDVEVLIEDSKTYLEAELNFQKTRVAFASDRAKRAALFAVVGFVFAWMALTGLTVGLVIALAPLLSAWGAMAAVVLGWLLIAGAAIGVAGARWRELTRSFASNEDERA